MIKLYSSVIINSMRGYELTLILKAELPTDKVLAKIKKIIADTGGKVGEVTEWGKREFSYPIKKPASPAGGQKEGVYYLLNLELEGKEAKKIEEKLKLEEAVLRHLLVRKE